jgi:hypothetical protein
MPFALGMVRLAGVGRIGEHCQDRVRPALGDLATEFEHGVGQDVPHLVDE